MLCDFGSMLQPGAETPAAVAGESTNGAHREGGAETRADLAAIGEESGGGGSGGNRWPRQETLALLQIRSDMDSVFRDSTHKGPLWDEVSRKMGEMGFKRSSKKCREKFENVYKYHKRTKEGRSTKSDGKSYRFFQQLEALESAAAVTSLPPIESGAVPIAMAMPPPRPPPPPPLQVTVLSMAPAPIPVNPMTTTISSPSSSSSTSSDEEVTAMRSKRRQKWKGFFEKLTREVMEKQEELQRKFLEALEKRENDRKLRDEAWKAQEIARLNREYDLLLQERSNSAAKDSALFSFLHKLSDQHKIPLPPPLLLHPHPQTPTTPAAPPESKPAPEEVAGSSRWPKGEIDALIKIRTSMEPKYQENGPKGALWEEISAAMRRLGYNRNAKRCKEKWENINKYFKRMKESNKRRRDDSKTCPYYHQLEELYREKKIKVIDAPPVMAALPEKQDPVSDNMDQDEDDDYDDEDEDEDLEGGYEIVANNGNGSSIGGAAAAMEAS